MSLRTVFFLLVVLVGLFGRADRVEDVLKDVGKRFSQHLPHGRAVPGKMSVQMMNRLYHVRKAKEFMKLSDEEVKFEKLNETISISEMIFLQGTDEYKYWSLNANQFYMLLSPQLEVQICDQKEKINYFQFMNFLDRRRHTFKLTKLDYSYHVFESDRKSLLFLIDFMQESVWGFKTKTTYNVTMKLFATELTPDFNFQITNITILGGCTDIGTISMNHTSINDFKEWDKGSSEEDLFKLLTPAELTNDWQDPDKIPETWLEGLDEDEFFHGRVCWSPATKSPRYRTEAFRSWYNRFSMIWHPKKGDTKFSRIQLLKAEPEEVKVRVTMRLQSGINESAPTHDWEMVMVSQFHKRGDGKWRVNEVEVSCPSTLWPTHMEHAFGVMPEIVTKAFTTRVTDKLMWWNALYFLKDFIKGEPECWICGKKVPSIDAMQQQIWSKGSPYYGEIAGYTLATQPGKASEDSWFSFDISVRIKHCITPTNCRVDGHAASWKFYIRWDRNDQFYNVYKAEFDCPVPEKNQKWKIFNF